MRRPRSGSRPREETADERLDRLIAEEQNRAAVRSMLDLLVRLEEDNQAADQHSKNLLVSKRQLRVAVLLEALGVLGC